MIFDALRQIADNWLPDIKPLVETAAVLHLPVTPHKVLPRNQDLETISSTSINFGLPHPVTAIEDNASCVLLIDTKPGLVGLAERRMFIECIPVDSDESNYNDTPAERAICEATKANSSRGVHVVTVGFVSSPAQRAGSYVAAGEVLWVVRGTITKQLTTVADFNALPPAAIELVAQGSIRNAMTAIEEIIAVRRHRSAAQL
jgi:hypothetical protein